MSLSSLPSDVDSSIGGGGSSSFGDDERLLGRNSAAASSTLRRSCLVSTEMKANLDKISASARSASDSLINERLDSLTANKLRFSSLELLGREQELETLEQCLDRCCGDDMVNENDTQLQREASSQDEGTAKIPNGTRELVFIQGLSGTGKSALCKHFVKKKQKKRRLKPGWGKFDLFLRDEPLSGFSDAFSSLCSHLMLETLHHKAFVEFRTSLLDTFHGEDEIPLLLSMIPNLQQVFGVDKATNTSTKATPQEDNNLLGDAGANSQRMKHIFRKLCRVLTAHFGPLVLILDDLQWADKTSLDLLETLANDRQNSKILFLVCFRSDNDIVHDVKRLRDNLTQSTYGGLNITDIEVGNLSLDHVHSVIKTLLSMDEGQENTFELAEICHRRTLGNIFFLLQFLTVLKEEALLEFHLGLFRWTWDLQKIESETAATANVVEMVTDRLAKLPGQLLSFLQLASCLGSDFHHPTLSIAWKHVAMTGSEDGDASQHANIHYLLDLAERGNFLEVDSPDSHRWLHDNIQEAAMALISPPEQIDAFKCRVGMTLSRHLTEEELDREIFVVANLLTTYKPEDNDKEALLAAVNLFLKAAEKATSVAAFQSAFRYATNGIAMLPSDCWVTCFDQALRLYSVATEASGFLAQVDEMLTNSAAVLDQPKCSILDKLRVYFVKLEYLQNNGESFAAVDLGLQILSKLGCSFPKTKVGQAMQTMRALQKWKKKPPTASALRQLSPMTNRIPKEIVKVIFRLGASFYYTRQIFLYALAASRSITLVVDHGLCDYSAGAFFDFGNILAVVNRDLEYLRAWSELSVLMTQLVPSGHHESRVLFSTACGFTWSQPIHSLPKSLLRGYKLGMKVGDTESAMWNCCFLLYFEFMAGRSLRRLEERCQLYILNMIDVRRNEAALVSAPIWRLVRDLIGGLGLSTELAWTTNGSKCAIEEVMGRITQTSPVAPHFARATKNMLHAYRREYVVGAELAIQRGNELLTNFPHQPIGVWDMFLRGLCLYSAAKKTGQRRYLRHARKVRATIEKWLSQGNMNVRHHTTLLAAEDLALQKKFNSARQSYESSIVAASRGGFLHDAALANERCALFLLDELNDRENARYHIREAGRLYDEWGAADVAVDLQHI